VAETLNPVGAFTPAAGVAGASAGIGLFFAFWSSRSDLIYTLSSHGRGGNLRFLDAQRLDPETKHPVGAATPVYGFDETLVPGMDPVWNNVSVDDSRIVLELGGVSTDIWIK